MALCSKCKQIPAGFFSVDGDPKAVVEYYVFPRLFEKRDCQLCELLTQRCQWYDHFVSNCKDKDGLQTRMIMLGRATTCLLWESTFRNSVGDPYVANNLSLNSPSIEIYLVEPMAKFGKQVIGSVGFEPVPNLWRTLPMVKVGVARDELMHMKTWIEECVENHPECGLVETTRPTRLLDVTCLGGSQDLRLIETSSYPDETFKYITLSHCWGPPSRSPLRTTASSLEQHKQIIPFSDLSLTFQDAVRITRALGIDYLWIDSLCIIQDSYEDWEREAAIMGLIYASSFCTLAASNSSDGTGGCRVLSPHHSVQDLRIGEETVRFVLEHNLETFSALCKTGPLQTRGWVLQERYLSKRIIHFTAKNLLWECQSRKATIDLPWLNQDPSDRINKKLIPRLLYDTPSEATDPVDSKPRIARDAWFRTLEEFSLRNLTFGKDKLPSLAGLAQHCSTTAHLGRYLAGSWEDHLPSGLLWRVCFTKASQQPERPDSYRAPTWSPLCIDAEIIYDSQYRAPAEPTIHERNHTLEERPEYDFGDFQILDISATPAGINPFGAISAASLRISGRLVDATIGSPLGPRGSTEIHRRALLDAERNPVGALYPDLPLDALANHSVLCLSVRDEFRAGGIHNCPSELFTKTVTHPLPQDFDGERAKVMGLALVSAGGDRGGVGGREGDGEMGDVYRRVGLVRWMTKPYFGPEPREITIV